jgi:oligopeptide transport system permease protein
MTRFIVRRLLSTALVLIVATFIFFSLVFLIPGDPIRGLFGFRPPPQAVLAQLRHEYGLDQSFLVQYWRYLGRLLTGDWGRSIRGYQVADALVGAVPISLRLLGAAIIGQALLGVFAGLIAATRKRTFVSALIQISSLVIVAIPVFVLAYLAQAVFGLKLHWLPVRGLTSSGWAGYVLPALVMAAFSSAYVARLMRVQMTDTLREPFVRAAVGLGVSRRRVEAVHALRPSLVPVVTLIAASSGQLVMALIFVEGVFDLRGLGGLVYEAIQSKDNMMVVGILTVVTLIVILSNLFVDVLAAIIDPRIRLE